MISKNRLKELAAYRLQKRCDEEAAFIVEGPKMAAEAMAAAVHVRALCATASWLQQHAADAVADEVHEVSTAELERISLMRSPNEVWLLCDRDFRRTATAAQPTLILALDHLQDPGNLGTLLRTADWYGVRRIICSDGTAGCFNPKVVQASMGAIFRTEVEYVDLPRWLAECGLPIYGASLRGQPLSQTALPEAEAVLLIGNESRGISPEAMRYVSHPVLIPNIGGTAESLNAAVAAGILLHWLASRH